MGKLRKKLHKVGAHCNHNRRLMYRRFYSLEMLLIEMFLKSIGERS